MATFLTDGRFGLFGGDYSAPALNSYNLFEHSFLYALETGTFSDRLVRGHFESNTDFSLERRWVELSGTELSVQTLGGFALTGGTITGYHESYYSLTGRVFFVSSYDMIATGISVTAIEFWDLASAHRWHDIWLLAVSGDDAMTGSNVDSNSDLIEGGAGFDFINAQAGDDTLWGNAGSDYLSGGDGSDWLVANDWAAGGVCDHWDGAHGDAGDDYLFTGGYGHGYLNGEAGEDRIWGGPQIDFLSGGTGIDYMAGGDALDVFEVTSVSSVAGEYDFILDFQDGVDFIKLPVGVAWNLADSAYGTIVSDPVTGFYLIVPYTTAAMVGDQIYYA